MGRQEALLKEHLARGDVQAGWKLGFGSRSGLELLALDAPLVGFLLASAELPSGSAVDVSGWHRPVAEPEIAVRLGRDLPPGARPTEVTAAVASFVPALELADVNPPPTDVVEILAGDIFQRRFVLGAEDASGWGSGPDELRAVVRHGAAETAVADVQELTGEFLSNLAHAALIAARHGRGLRAGDIILMGSVVPPVALTAGDVVTFAVAGREPVSVSAGPGSA